MPTYSEIEDAYYFADAAQSYDGYRVVYDRQTDRCLYFAGDQELDPIPDDIDDEERYIDLPGKIELDLGTNLVFEFAAQQMPDDYEDVCGIFRRSGAYGRFKHYLADRNRLDDWYTFERAAQRMALEAWCVDNGIEITDTNDA